MFPGCLDPVTGRLRIKEGVPPTSGPTKASWNHGIAFGVDFVYASFDNTAPTIHVNGLPTNAIGQLCKGPGLTAVWLNGLPLNLAEGVSVAEVDPTHFVNGVPIVNNRVAIVKV